MSLSNKSVNSITEADLLALISDKEAEGKTIDYKRTLPGKKDDDRREFLYDVSSFANTLGGHLVFGMDEADGFPTKLLGLAGVNPDEEIGRLEQMSRDGIRPPIAGLHTCAIGLPDGSHAIVMRVPKSWNQPHQVTFQKAFRFYGRDSNGRYQMDVDELRSIFSLSETVSERVRQFRIDRVRSFASEGGPCAPPLPRDRAYMVTHLLPLSAFAGASRVDLRVMNNNTEALVDIIGGFNYPRFNADGYVAFSDDSYVQVFRDGCLEAVNAVSSQHQPQGQPSHLPGRAFEGRMFRHIDGGKRLLHSLGLEPPIVLFVSFTGLKGMQIGVSPEYRISERYVFDRDPLLLPETVIEAFGQTFEAEARPHIDATWNAAGWPSSPHYNDAGTWDPNSR